MDEPHSYRPADVVGMARRLEQRITDLLAGLTMARKPRDLLTKAKDKVTEVAAILEEVDRDLVPLSIRRDDHPLSACRSEWGALPNGRISATDASMQRLLTQSPTLSTMYRGGLNFLDFYHFGDDDLARASDIGDVFNTSPAGWDKIRRAILSNQNWVRFERDDFQTVNQVAARLRPAGILAAFHFEILPYRSNTWERIDPKRIPHLPGNSRLRIIFDAPKQPELTTLITGEWLTALTLNIIADHFTRNDRDFEVYSKVGYETAEGLTRVRGDFDVLVRSQERILAVECKSGKLDVDRGHFETLATKAERLTQVFEATRSDISLTFWLVFNHHLNEKDDILEHLEKTDIVGVTLGELRGQVKTLFK